MIEINNLKKDYGGHLAVNNISFTINDGEILGFLGPNGAGKSTTMNIITGYLSATEGNVVVNGYDILEEPKLAKKEIGYLPELPPLYLDMTVREYLNFVYDLKGVKLPKGPHIEEICRLVKIKNVYHRLIKNLSKGYRQRVGIAQALIGNPKVLILDEPTVGLDPKQIIEIRNLIRMLGKHHTVILSSHILSEIQAVCDRVVVINKGKIIADDTPQNLSTNLSDDHSLNVVFEGKKADIENKLKQVQGVKSVLFVKEYAYENSVEFNIDPLAGYDIRKAIFEMASLNNFPILRMASNELTLEDIFLRLTDETYNTSALEKSLETRKKAVEVVDGKEEIADDSADEKEKEEE